MKIRKIKKSDLSACAKILKSAYGNPPYNEVFKDLTANKYVEGKYKYCKNNSFVATDEGNEVIGFIFLNISTWSNGGQAVLEEIVVNPDFQGKGVGRKLMEYAQNYLNSLEIKSAMLWAKKEDSLIDFYKKQGYFLADDFVVMFKNFK